MQVRECMTANVKIANPGMTLREAAAIMRECDTGFLPVVNHDKRMSAEQALEDVSKHTGKSRNL